MNIHEIDLPTSYEIQRKKTSTMEDIEHVPSSPGTSSSSSSTATGLRGRGRPVKARRGRGRGRGRGRLQVSEDRDLAKRRQQTCQRSKSLQNTIDSLPESEVRAILKLATERHPSLIFDIMEAGQPGGSGHHPPSGAASPSWCVCLRCREMPKIEERLCCGKQTNACNSRLADFEVLVLDEAVLALSRLLRQELLVLQDDPEWCKANRHAAYRQFTLWQHGRLGAGIRRIVPSCCVWRIRDRYPDPFGQYTGFVASRFA